MNDAASTSIELRENSPRPDVFQFADFRAYLGALYVWAKAQDSTFSHAVFAERAGLQSRSYLRLVISGRRNLSSESIQKFSVGFSLTKKEALAFGHLVRSNQATSFAERAQSWEKFCGLKGSSTREKRRVDPYMFLSRWYLPAILSILKQSDVSHAPEDLANVLNLSPKEIETGLSNLLEMGIIKKTDSASFEVVGEVFETADDIPNVAIQAFHANSLNKALDAVNLPPSLREFQSLVMPLNAETFLWVRQELRSLANRLQEKLASVDGGNQAVYSINLNLVPISKSFIRSETSCQRDFELNREGEMI